jgi:hypothetical protein
MALPSLNPVGKGHKGQVQGTIVASTGPQPVLGSGSLSQEATAP